MPAKPFVRRLILPLTILVLLACGAIAAIATFADDALIYSAIPVGIVAFAAAAAIVFRYFAMHTQEVADMHAINAQQLGAQAFKDRDQLRTIISSMAEGLIAVDHQQRVLLINDTARTLLKCPPIDATGRPLWEVVTQTPLLKTVSEISLTGQRKTVELGPIDGRHLEVTVSRLAARPTGLVIVIHDVTEATQYEQLRREFVANVSHELRTPLSVIKGFVETLLDGAIDDRGRAIEYLSKAHRHTNQLTNLVQDLLELSRLENGTTPSARAPIDVAAMLTKVAELMHPAAAEKSHELVVDVDANVPTILGAAPDLERAIANLLENAIKYTPAGGKIRVKACQENRGVSIRVIDNGIGIPTDEQPRIFERFYRVDRSRSREMGGTGLGLSIVKHAVQSHGGSVNVQSLPGAGTTFTMWLPAADDKSPPS